ncbi:MAG: protoporphyrinogen oxidase [Verrucomicrobia bacterium RIFCSPLOWO2_12_FULL_64_8]|nr:MAG: protoporphyrinogen oxidase [Verrucomicrobia bacterium RIFCSPLOWO2_12_FULL_64_8]
MPTVAIIGGGLTGLTAAHELTKAGREVRLFEAAARTGGAVVSHAGDGWLVEGGPNTLLETPDVVSVVNDLGLAAERLEASPAAKNRFLLRGGRLIAAPMAPPKILTTPLLSLGAKLRLFAEPFRRPRRRSGDVSLAEFIRDHFGQEVVDYVMNPFVAGIYAGDVAKLSTRHAFAKIWAIEQTHGSIIRGQIAAMKQRRARGEPAAPRSVSFVRGLQTLTDTLAARLPAGTVRTGAAVESLLPGRPWRVIWRQEGATHTTEAEAVVLALPAAAMARLAFGTLGERPLAALEAVEYPPVTSLFLGFRRAQVTHPLDGFGVLVPAIENRSVLGVLFSSTLFPHRAPAGHVALTVFVGGARQPDVARLAPEKLLAHIAPDLSELLGVSGSSVFVRHTAWPRAIPQYNLGYERFLDAMAQAEASHPGLFIGGHVRDGIALSDCLAAGKRLAAAVGKYII